MFALLVSLVVLVLVLKTALMLAAFFVRLLALCIALALVLGLAGNQVSHERAWEGDGGGKRDWGYSGEWSGSAHHGRPLGAHPIPDDDAF